MGKHGKHWPLVRLFASLVLALWTGAAMAECRQALALGLDVSGSVDAREYRLQVVGLARALDKADVRAALLANPEFPVRLAIYEWSGPRDQRMLVPWTAIDSAPTLDLVVETLAQTKRETANPGTALGQAMWFGINMLAAQNDCARLVLDISGDGKSNLGPLPRDVKSVAEGQRVMVNALVIGSNSPQAEGEVLDTNVVALAEYFRTEVITGAGAFVETAIGFEDYANAMRRKLLRELQALVISSR